MREYPDSNVRFNYTNKCGYRKYMQFIFCQLNISSHYSGSHLSVALPWTFRMATGVLWSTMGIRDSSWNLVLTHLSGKTQTSSYTAHGGRYNVIQIRIRGSIQFKRSKANIIQRFIVKRKHFIGGLDQLMNS